MSPNHASASHRAGRRRHEGQLGLTLIELLVSMTILAIIGGSIAGAFAIGFVTLSPTGAQAKLVGNHDLLAFEQQIGADVARADCLAFPGVAIPSPCGSGKTGFPSKCQSGYLLCVAWYDPDPTLMNAPCHTVTYSDSGAFVQRSDDHGAPERISTGDLTLAISSWKSTVINGYTWASQLTLKASQKSAAGAPTPRANPAIASYVLVPLVADPNSPVLPAGTSPC